MIGMAHKNTACGKNDLLKDAMRVELENEQKKFIIQTFGSEHPLARMQQVRIADARTRLVIRETRRTAQDVANAISARKSEIGDLASRSRITKEVDILVDSIAEIKDEVNDFREAFTSSEYDDV